MINCLPANLDVKAKIMSSTVYDVLIIGSGPAGYTAGIYAGRANLKVLMLEGIERGGQLMITSDVENYPGFPEGIQGPELMEHFRNQCHRFGTELVTDLATEVVLGNGRPYTVKTGSAEYKAQSIIISTGASARFLGIPSEKAYKGKGVSACATCDGFFFRGKTVAVVGGGDSAMEEAVFLTKFATKVYLLHRRDTFRASKIMLERAQNNEKIELRTFVEVDEIHGDESTGTVNALTLKDTRNQELSKLEVEGLFIAIGHDPNTALFKGQLPMNEQGYLLTEAGKAATSVPGVFAAGDVQDAIYRQAITAAGSGCMAAIEAERFLEAN